jgi:hypothetical protein
MGERTPARGRWRDRFKSDTRVAAEQRAAGRAPDATADEVGVARDNVGWSGRPLRSRGGNGPSTGSPASPDWPGWGAG